MKKTMFVLSLMVLGISLSSFAQEPVKQKREFRSQTLQPKTIDRNSMQVKMDPNSRPINKFKPQRECGDLKIDKGQFKNDSPKLKKQTSIKKDNKRIRKDNLKRARGHRMGTRLENNSAIQRVRK
jgi:hypothetical protein